MNDKRMELLEVLFKKELLLNDAVEWLKKRGLWEQFKKETGWNITEEAVAAPPEE